MTDMQLIEGRTQPAGAFDAPAWAGEVEDSLAAMPRDAHVRHPGSDPRRTIDHVARHLRRANPEVARLHASSSLEKTTGLVDVLFHQEDDPHQPDEVFGRLRWG